MLDRMLSIKEAAVILNMSYQTCHRLVREGKIKGFVKIDKMYRCSLSKLAKQYGLQYKFDTDKDPVEFLQQTKQRTKREQKESCQDSPDEFDEELIGTEEPKKSGEVSPTLPSSSTIPDPEIMIG